MPCSNASHEWYKINVQGATGARLHLGVHTAVTFEMPEGNGPAILLSEVCQHRDAMNSLRSTVYPHELDKVVQLHDQVAQAHAHARTPECGRAREFHCRIA